MANSNSETSLSRRSILKRTAGALAVGGGGFAAADGVVARQEDDASEVLEGVTCGDDHPEGSTFTVGPRCDDDCSVIQLTGLSPACLTDEKQLYVDLPATDSTVWMNPRNGEIPPGTYRVERAEQCEADAGECDGDALYRLEFRPADD